MIGKTKEGRPETANLKLAGFKCLLAVKNTKTLRCECPSFVAQWTVSIETKTCFHFGQGSIPVTGNFTCYFVLSLFHTFDATTALTTTTVRTQP